MRRWLVTLCASWALAGADLAGLGNSIGAQEQLGQLPTQNPFDSRATQPPPEGASGTIDGDAGPRARDAASARIANPLGRVSNRIANRVQNRINSRIDRNHIPRTNPADSYENAEARFRRAVSDPNR